MVQGRSKRNPSQKLQNNQNNVRRVCGLCGRRGEREVKETAVQARVIEDLISGHPFAPQNRWRGHVVTPDGDGEMEAVRGALGRKKRDYTKSLQERDNRERRECGKKRWLTSLQEDGEAAGACWRLCAVATS